MVTSCPHCLHALRHDYPQFGANLEVVHHTQLIDHLFAEGKLKAAKTPVETITYHDSCYLGRWNREFDAPRNIIKSVLAPGGDPRHLRADAQQAPTASAVRGRRPHVHEEHEGQRGQLQPR